MNYPCDLIQDLLPLYEEGLCSGASRDAVESHLEDCPKCRSLRTPLPEVQLPPETPQAEKAVKKSIRQVRRRWLTSLIAAVLIVPVLFLGVNQIRGQGICFTNADDYLTARRYLSALEKQEWQAVAQMEEYAGSYQSIMTALSMSTDEWGPRFTATELNGCAYRQTITAEQYDLQTAADLFGFLYNRQGRVFLDTALWEQVCAVEPEAVEQSGNKYTINLVDYFRFETPWGEFIGNMDTDISSPYTICISADLLPEQLWQEARTDLLEDSQSVFRATHEAYDYVAAMTEAEFTDYMVEKHTADLSALEKMGITITCTGFRGAYRQPENGGWVISLGVRVTKGNQSEDCRLDILVGSGHACYHGLSHSVGTDTLWLEDLSEILYPSAHPDY